MCHGKRALILLLILISLHLSFAGCTYSEPPTPEENYSTPGATPATTIAAVSAPWGADGVISEGEYPDSLELADGKFSVFWKTDRENLYMALRGNVQGWVAVGFDPSAGMKDADIILGTVKDGNAVIYDMYSTGIRGPHPPDTDLGGSDDILKSAGSEAGGVTIIEFCRKLDTGDGYDKVLKNGEEVRALWGMADVDDPDLKHNVGRGTFVMLPDSEIVS